MTLRIADAARAEALDAARWYDAERAGLGDEFVAALLEASEHIEANPLAWPVWPAMRPQVPPVRRYVMRRFPYSLAFQILDDDIEIVAVAHSSRRPGYWQRR